MEGSSDDKIDWYISTKKREYNRENFLILIEIKNIYTNKAIMT